MMIQINKIGYFFYFTGFYLYELALANLRIAHDILTPVFHIEPAIIEIELQVKKDLEILLLSNLITMTPGTLTMDISDDRKKIFVHGMYVGNAEEFIEHIHKFEHKLHKLLG